MEQLSLKKYKKGDKLAGVYVGMPTIAGANLMVASAYGIYADVFDKGTYYQVPNVVSMNKGSGRFLDFLITLKRGLDKPVFFCTITNMGLYKYLHRADIGIVKSDEKGKKQKFYMVDTMIAYSLKPTNKPKKI